MSYEKDQIAKKERRERIAVKFAQGLLASDKEYDLLDLVCDAIRCADLFIAELDKEQQA